MLKFKQCGFFFFFLDSCFNCTGFLTANYQPLLSEAEKEPTVSLTVSTQHGVEREIISPDQEDHAVFLGKVFSLVLLSPNLIMCNF